MHNCDLINLEDMLQNGTVISGTMIEKPHSFSTACNIATQIIAQIASSQYGGQSISLSHLAPFVDLSRKKFRKDVKAELEAAGIEPTDEQINKITEVRVKDEINRGVQMIQYQVITLMTTNGQAPFVTVFMYLDEVPEGQTRDDLKLIIEEVLRQRIQGVKNESGVWITPAFPKLIYVLDEDNITEGSKYWDVTCLAAKCTAKRMVPDYISAKKMKELKIDKNGNPAVYTCMGCRSFLTPYVDPKTGKGKYYGRFNQGVVTLNLVDIACSSGGDMTKFWKIFDERLDLCYRALMCRHNRLLGTPSDVAPILWQYGALARLKKGEKIDKLLFGGYSTISLGYAGLYECVKYMTGKSHTDPDAKDFAIAVMQKLNDACNTWKSRKTSTFPFTALRLNPQPTNSLNACKSDSEKSPALQIKTISQTAIMCMFPKRLTLSKSLNLKRNFKSFLPAVPSAMLKYRTCRITFPLFYPLCNIFTIISCMPSSTQRAIIARFADMTAKSKSLKKRASSFGAALTAATKIKISLMLPAVPAAI